MNATILTIQNETKEAKRIATDVSTQLSLKQTEVITTISTLQTGFEN